MGIGLAILTTYLSLTKDIHKMLSLQAGSHLSITQDEGHVRRKIMHPNINMDRHAKTSTLTCPSAV